MIFLLLELNCYRKIGMIIVRHTSGEISLNNILKVSLLSIAIAIVTTVVTIFVLSRMGIIFVNTPEFEKGKELLKVDNLSQLLELDYPKIGEDIQEAYNLFGEVDFETDNEIDFNILDGRKTVFIEYKNETNTIEQMEIFSVNGELEEVRVLGEKMLPDGYELISEDHFTKEDKNEIGRYNITEFFNDYFYEIKDTGNVVRIRLHQRVTDLIEEPDPNEPIEFDVVVSYSSENEVGLDENNIIDVNTTVEIDSSEESETSQKSVSIAKEEQREEKQQNEAAATPEDLANAMYEGNIDKFGSYLEQNDFDNNSLSLLLTECSYLSRDRNNYGFNAFAERLISYGATPNYLDEQGYSPLSHSVFFGNVALAEMLIETGADKEFVSPSGKTIKEDAYEMGIPEMIALFE
jgi:hypothetical protein